MIKALSIALTIDLKSFSTYLWQRSIAHKITEERGQQIIWVEQHSDVNLVHHYYKHWKAGTLSTPVGSSCNNNSEARTKNHFEPHKTGNTVPKLIKEWLQTPATLTIVILSIITTLLMNLLPDHIVLRWLIFINPASALQWITQHGPSHSGVEKFNALAQVWMQTLASVQWWRLITPMFLHFSLLHIAFNAAMFIFFGQRVESHHGVKTLLILVVTSSVFSNLVQYFSGNFNSIIFGGLSGVIYGLIGFCWIRAKETPDGYGIPRGIYGFMIVWLLLGYTGILDSLVGIMANGAHAGGLIAGMITGLLSARNSRRKG